MDRKYQIDTQENQDFLKEVRDDLLEFGRSFPSSGGSAWYLGDDGTPWKEHDRELWITCRMAHVYCLADLLGISGSRDLARAALGALNGELKDRDYGGWYAGLTEDGGIVPDKQAYAHAFVILAGSSGVAAGIEGAEKLLQDALECFDLKFWDATAEMVCDTWNTEFTVLDEYRGLNANMHTVEAFLAAADVTGDEKYRYRAECIISKVVDWAEANDWRIPEHYTKNWIPEPEKNKECPDDAFKPYGATPGHGLEWARLIAQWVLSEYPENEIKKTQYISAAQKLYQRAVQDAWDADGAPGIVYTTDWNGKPVVHDRMHWTLAEAVNTAASLFHITNKKEYADDYAKFWEYIDKFLIDHEKGSWFHQLDKDNHVLNTVWPGKPDIYHAVQATLIPYYRADLSIAPAIRQTGR